MNKVITGIINTLCKGASQTIEKWEGMTLQELRNEAGIPADYPASSAGVRIEDHQVVDGYALVTFSKGSSSNK